MMYTLAFLRNTLGNIFVVLAIMASLFSTNFTTRSLASPVLPPAAEHQLLQSDQPMTPGPTLDIARAVPYPADFQVSGAAFGFLDGRFVSGDDQALRTLDGQIDEAALRGAKRQLLRAGWLRRYESRLAAPLADNPNQFGIQVSSFVVEYASAQDAANAFAALAQDQAVTVDALVGEESFTLRLTGTTPDTSTEYEAVKLIFRVGPLLCSMTYADLTGTPPSIDTLVTAGRLVADRARIVIEKGTVPLGTMVVQFTESAETRDDLYAIRAGVQTRLLSQTMLDSFALPQGAGDAFVSRLTTSIVNPEPTLPSTGDAQAVIEVEGEVASTPQPINALTTAPAPRVSLFTALFSFNADGEASEWLSVAGIEAANGRDGALEPIESPPLGDESMAFQLFSSAQSADRPAGFLLFTRFGTIGIIQELHSSTGVSLEGAANVMRQQLTCIARFGCEGVVDVPLSVFGGRDVPLAVDLAPEQAQESAEAVVSEPVNEPAPAPVETLPAVEPEPIVSLDEAPVAESASEVPEELTEPEITSAPEPAPTPEEQTPVDLPAEPEPTPVTDPAPESAPTTTPVSESSELPTDSEVTPVPEAAETPAANNETPAAVTDAPPAENADAPVPEATAAPIPADAPIGENVPPPPAEEVVQTPADATTDPGAAPDFTEPVPAATEADSGDANADR
jgi:hypothetical protein